MENTIEMPLPAPPLSFRCISSIALFKKAFYKYYFVQPVTNLVDYCHVVCVLDRPCVCVSKMVIYSVLRALISLTILCPSPFLS